MRQKCQRLAFSRSAINVSGKTRWPRYFFEAHAASFPLSPFPYASMNLRACLAYLVKMSYCQTHWSSQIVTGTMYCRIISKGTDSITDRRFFSRSSSFDVGGYWRYVLFEWPQHCSMKFNSQWNFSRKSTSNLRPRHKISSADSWSAKSGWLYRTRHWQHAVASGGHLKFLHSALSFASLVSPRCCKILVIPINTPFS